LRIPEVIVIGGAPGAGKSTLGAALAERLGRLSVSMDDIYVATQAITTPESHPWLHCMRRVPSHVYFTESTTDQLIADAAAQHAALLPAILAVIRFHIVNGPPIVMDGWFITPADLHALASPAVHGVWLVTTDQVLLERERKGASFYSKSSDPERMLTNFLARSLWHNNRLRKFAADLGHPVLEQDGTLSPEALCDLVQADLAGTPMSKDTEPLLR